MATIQVNADDLRGALERLRGAMGRRRAVEVSVTIDPRGLVLEHAGRQERVPGPSRGMATLVVDGPALARLAQRLAPREDVTVEIAGERLGVGAAELPGRVTTEQLALAFAVKR